GERTEQADGCPGSLDQGGRDDDVRDRVPTSQDRDDVVHDGTDLRGHDSDSLRKRRKRALPRGIEQALRGEFLARLLVRGPERADARRGRGLDEQLDGPSTWG